MRRRRIASTPGDALRALSGRRPTLGCAGGLAGQPSVMVLIVGCAVAVAATLSDVVPAVPAVVAMLGAIALGVAIAAPLLRRRVALILNGEHVLVRNIWRSHRMALADITALEDQLVPWSRGLYSLVIVRSDGSRVPILATATFRLTEVRKLRTTE